MAAPHRMARAEAVMFLTEDFEKHLNSGTGAADAAGHGILTATTRTSRRSLNRSRRSIDAISCFLAVS